MSKHSKALTAYRALLAGAVLGLTLTIFVAPSWAWCPPTVGQCNVVGGRVVTTAAGCVKFAVQSMWQTPFMCSALNIDFYLISVVEPGQPPSVRNAYLGSQRPGALADIREAGIPSSNVVGCFNIPGTELIFGAVGRQDSTGDTSPLGKLRATTALSGPGNRNIGNGGGSCGTRVVGTCLAPADGEAQLAVDFWTHDDVFGDSSLSRRFYDAIEDAANCPRNSFGTGHANSILLLKGPIGFADDSWFATGGPNGCVNEEGFPHGPAPTPTFLPDYCGGQQPSPTPIAAATSLVPTFTSGAGPTETPSLTPTSTGSSTPSSTPTRTPTFTRTPSQTFTSTPTQTPTFTKTLTNTPIQTPSRTRTPTNTPICAETPRACSASSESELTLEGNADPGKRKLEWRWESGTVATGGFGNPVTGNTNYRLCVYDDGKIKMTPRIAAGGTCGNGPCWGQNALGVIKYSTNTPNADGITDLILTPGTGGKAKIRLLGKGATLRLPLPLTDGTRVTAQLVGPGDTPTCWEGVYPAPPKKTGPEDFSDAIP